jgi:hypothetical protein
LIGSHSPPSGRLLRSFKIRDRPHCCDGLDLPEILGPFQARLTDLPCHYLGLPLRLGRLRKDDEQVLIDRVATKLPN